MSENKTTVMAPGSSYRGFEVLSVFELKDYHSTAVHLIHKKTGLEVLHLVNDEVENLFAFAFRTLNKKGNGAAHIMEHSVLCGSEKYPLKDPFTILSNQSVKTYLNAATYSDKTVYPASSTIEADYFNLMSVYADAVFFPRLSKEIFMQEAHRLEIDDKGNPSIQGVVYNEMKGNYSSFESVAMDVPVRNLLKGSIYAKDSGGDPLEIPELTYDDYLAFHKKWYKPENCLVFLYGNIETQKQLDFLEDNYLLRLENKRKDFTWSPEVKDNILAEVKECVTALPVNEHLFVEAEGPAGEAKENGNTVYLTWNIGQSKNAHETIEKVFLASVLLNHDGSPLQKALVESDFGEDTAPGMGLDSLYSNLFTVGLRGVKKADTFKLKEFVFKTLEDICKNGIKKEDIDSTLMAFEFSHREIRRSRGPYALILMNAPINAWLYGYDIQKSFKLRIVIEEIKEKILSNKGYLEGLIKKYFLENKNFILSQITPSKKYAESRDKAEKQLIEKLMKESSAEEIKKENEKLHEFQSSKEDVNCLPHLHPKDFIEEGKRLTDNIQMELSQLKDKDGNSVDYFISNEKTNGITYLDVAYPADVLAPEEYKYLPLFTDTVSDCGWGTKDWSSAAETTALHTGGINCVLLTNELAQTEKSNEYIKAHDYCGREWVIFKLKVIDEKLKDGLELLADNINLVDFHDYKRLSDIAIETRNDFESSIIPSGHQYAMLRSLRSSSKVSAVDEIWNGLSQLYTLNELAAADPKKNSEIFDSIFKKLKNGGGFIHITAEKELIEKEKDLIQDFVNKISLKKVSKKAEYKTEDFVKLTDIENTHIEPGETENIIIPAQIGYAAESMEGIPYGIKGNAIVEICGHWLSNILLWERIRTIGGSYGAFCDNDSITGRLIFATYRDPTPEKSNDVFEQSLKDASEMTFTMEEVEKAVMGSYSQFVVPKTPRARGSIALIRTLYGITDDDRENKLLEILKCTPDDFKQTFQKLYEFSQGVKHRVIIGSDSKSMVGKKVTLPL